ncbi:hypothetical protein ALC62_06057 [Cyphomyrmex costatus]|uniref:Uncharacterized protein n=1 Tax=Cyphomyrmex costatus TaxID=456900 RepID=A0A195CRC6_9HYME|nr:hypothetical protein ALC62_06057 [Cyphomyrmex costatus]
MIPSDVSKLLASSGVAHPVHATGHSATDEWAHPVDPQMFILIVHHGWTQTPSRIHTAAGDAHRRHMSYRNCQANREWGPTFHVGPLGIRNSVHNQHQQKRNDYFHCYTLSVSYFRVQRGGAEAKGDLRFR